MENLLFLGVPILRHFRVTSGYIMLLKNSACWNVQAMPFEVRLMLTMITRFANLRHNAFAMSAGLNKTVSTFHFFDALHAFKSSHDA